MASLAQMLRSRAGAPRSFTLNTAVTAVNIVVRLGVGFALLPLLLDGIGAARTGLFLFATTLTGYFTAVDNSVGASVTRYVAEHRARDEPAQLAATVRSSFVVLAGFGGAAALVLLGLALFASDSLFGGREIRGAVEPTLLVTALTSALYWPSRVGVAALNGLERYDQSAQIQITTSILLLGSLGWLAHAHASVAVLAGVYGVTTVLEGLVSAALAWRPLAVSRLWLRGPWVRGAHMRGVVRFGAAAFLIGIGDTLINSFDRAIVGSIVGAAAIVGYDIAQRPQQAVSVISGLAGTALISPVARLAALGERRQMQELVLVATFLSIIVAAPIAVLVMVLARPVIDAWLGSHYTRYAIYLDVFTAYWVLGCATAAVSSALYGIGRLQIYAQIMIAVGAVSLPLSLGLTFAWGTIGVIWGTAIPSVASVPVFVFYGLALLEIPLTVFFRSALLPAYGIVLAWSAAVIAGKLLLEPHGYPGLIAFSALALTVCWGASLPMLRDRLRAVRRLDDGG